MNDHSTLTGTDQRAARNYRPDIDGLRALAVLPIVAFHLDFNSVPGGYVGVDIFFVISGYLIGGIVLDQSFRGTYSLKAFYIRRFRRIIPAVVAMLTLVTLAFAVTSFPKALIGYAESLIFTSVFASNFYFWNTSGYFAAAAETKPLLHMWSLAVEEQFYIIFPLIVMMTKRLGRGRVWWILAALSVLSLALSTYWLVDYSRSSFYLLPARIWELLLGVLAVEARLQLLERRIWREAAAIIGLALIAISLRFYTEETPFPGLSALLPCGGTAMLLLAGAHGRTSVGQLLSIRPAVFFGLISYSLYLWHWPIVVLLKELLPVAVLPRAWRVFAFALAVLLAWTSWRVIERPWRSPTVSGRKVLRFTAAGVAALVASAVMILLLDGLPSRFSPQVVRIAAVANDTSRNFHRAPGCFIGTGSTFADFDRQACVTPEPGKTNILLMGDSHAGHLWSGLQRTYPEINFLQANSPGCKPLIDGPRSDADCARLIDYLFNDFLARTPIDWVLLSGQWNESHLEPLARTLDWFRQRHIPVIVAGPIVRYRVALPHIMALAAVRGDEELIERLRMPGGSALDRDFAEVARRHGALYFPVYGALCSAGTCRTRDASGLPVQLDRDHLTAAGSLIVARAFPAEQVLRTAGRGSSGPQRRGAAPAATASHE